MVTIDSGKEEHDHVVNISPALALEENHAIESAIQHAMARIWVWDGESRAPPPLVDGLVEYISMVGGFGPVNNFDDNAKLLKCDHIWWEDKDPKVVAHFLGYCERHQKGFIQRLNQAMKDRWHDRMVDDALGMPAQNLCSSYTSSNYQLLKQDF